MNHSNRNLSVTSRMIRLIIRISSLGTLWLSLQVLREDTSLPLILLLLALPCVPLLFQRQWKSAAVYAAMIIIVATAFSVRIPFPHMDAHPIVAAFAIACLWTMVFALILLPFLLNDGENDRGHKE